MARVCVFIIIHVGGVFTYGDLERNIHILIRATEVLADNNRIGLSPANCRHYRLIEKDRSADVFGVDSCQLIDVYYLDTFYVRPWVTCFTD